MGVGGVRGCGGEFLRELHWSLGEEASIFFMKNGYFSIS